MEILTNDLPAMQQRVTRRAFLGRAGTGLGALALAACYWLIEARGFRRWAMPFAWFGVNALALFFLSTLVAKLLIMIRVGPEATRLHAWLFERLFAPWAAPLDASLAWALAYAVRFVVPGWAATES